MKAADLKPGMIIQLSSPKWLHYHNALLKVLEVKFNINEQPYIRDEALEDINRMYKKGTAGITLLSSLDLLGFTVISIPHKKIIPWL